MICLRLGKTNTAKTPPGDFKVTNPENPLLSQQAATSKGISVPYTNLQLNPYPNTQLDLFCSDNFSFWCTAPKYVTNQFAQIPIRDFNHQLERMLARKFFSSSIRWRSRRCLVIKPYGAHTQQSSSRERDELGQELHLRSQFAWTKFAQYLCNLWTLWRPLK